VQVGWQDRLDQVKYRRDSFWRCDLAAMFEEQLCPGGDKTSGYALIK
jgi:hypothetical protein